MILHVFEACIWAAFYGWYKLFPDWETSIYFSVVSYATIGYGDVVLPETWRLLGAIEGITGVLLCGVSTAFLFAIINAFFRMRVEQIQEKRSD
jgi:voltage-gated potassium channel Kch